jgi:two-component system sensor histidine kinase BaeS
VTPATLLFIGDPAERSPGGLGLPSAGLGRVVGAAVVVLVLTVAASVLVAARPVRSMRTLTAAAQRMGAGDRSTPVAVRGKGEVGQLAAAFNKMAEQLARTEEQRKAMISDVSHELRTPLGNIRGWLVATQDGVADLDPALVSSLLEETGLLQHLVDDLQQLALADAGNLALQPEPVSLGELLHQVAAAHQSGVDAAGIALHVRARGDLLLPADPVRLRQAIGNLLTNAVRHTPRGGRVTLRAYQRDDDAVIEVSDTGTGIDADHLPHVFDRFWRVDKSRNRQTGGSGLGLAIVRHLVEAHGGSVAVASTPGDGTTFTIRLPR